MKPLCIDLFTGLHGWAEGFLAEGWRVIGYDIHDMRAAVGLSPLESDFELRLQDVLTIDGRELADAHCIVASPPCQRYSYMAMPWTRAKELARHYREHPDLIESDLNALFSACFRIQREASAEAGRHIPLIIENVKGAQAWVGPAKWRYGSYYLWGDVPGLMLSAGLDGKKGEGGAWFNDYKLRPRGGAIERLSCTSSKSRERRAASAMIARIPLPLARWIAQVYRPLPKEQDAPEMSSSGICPGSVGNEMEYKGLSGVSNDAPESTEGAS